MEDSKIGWTDHTFNPWHGCMKVSDGCKRCYAEIQDNRFNHAAPHWGANSARKPMSVSYWKKPIKWNRDAALAGVYKKVFCASMADWAEANDTLTDYQSQLMVADARLDLFQLIATTPNLIWQLLTKRPDNIMNVIETAHTTLEMYDVFEDGNKEYLAKYSAAYALLTNWLNGEPPVNVWLGTTVESSKYQFRIDTLRQIPARIRFVSYEPALGPIDPNLTNIHWLICGGESGIDRGVRIMRYSWVTFIKKSCERQGVAFFFKQWGEWLYRPEPKGLDFEFSVRVGKKKAGSLLDGEEYKDFPALS